MPKFTVVYALSGAWEEWIVSCPDGTTDDAIRNGTAEVTFEEMTDSGNTTMAVEGIEPFDDED